MWRTHQHSSDPGNRFSILLGCFAPAKSQSTSTEDMEDFTAAMDAVNVDLDECIGWKVTLYLGIELLEVLILGSWCRCVRPQKLIYSWYIADLSPTSMVSWLHCKHLEPGLQPEVERLGKNDHRTKERPCVATGISPHPNLCLMALVKLALSNHVEFLWNDFRFLSVYIFGSLLLKSQ